MGESLFERAQARIPGGVNSPVRAFGAVGGEPFFVARGERRAPGRHRRARVRRLRAVVGRLDPRPRTSRGGRGRAARRGRRHVVRGADRTRGRARGGDLRARARGREGAVRLVGHRGRDDRAAPRPRCDRPYEDREVRGLLPRSRRRPARAGRQRRRDVRPAGLRGSDPGHGCRHDRRSVQRPRRARLGTVGARHRRRRGDRRAHRRQHGPGWPRRGLPRRAARAVYPRRRPARARRGDHRVSGRARRRAGSLRRALRTFRSSARSSAEACRSRRSAAPRR